MTPWPRLSRAPIVESIVDFRVHGSDTTIEAVIEATDELAQEFPSRQEMKMFVAHLNLAATPKESSLTAGDTPAGIVMHSVDGKWVAQFRLDGFSLSRLMPYDSWQELADKASSLWARYRTAVRPEKVVRVACRFVNRIPLVAGESFDKTFLTNFVLGQSLPQSLAGYLLRVLLPFEEQEAMAILTQSLQGDGSDCVFDIDAFSEKPQGFDEHDIWQKLDDLRAIKNRIFFGSLTSAALERFR